MGWHLRRQPIKMGAALASGMREQPLNERLDPVAFGGFREPRTDLPTRNGDRYGLACRPSLRLDFPPNGFRPNRRFRARLGDFEVQ